MGERTHTQATKSCFFVFTGEPRERERGGTMMDVRKNKRRVKICVLSMGGYKDRERNTHIQKRVQYILHAIGVCVCVCGKG